MTKLVKYFLPVLAALFFWHSPRADDALPKQDFDTMLEDGKKVIEDEFAGRFAAVSGEIADLGLQMEELLAQDKKDKGEGETDPNKVREETMNALSYREGDKISLADEKNKAKSRIARLSNTLRGALNKSGENIAQTTDKKERQEVEAQSSTTQKGTSEALASAVASTTKQIDALYRYLETELASLEAATVDALATSNIKVKDVKSAIDICEYTGENASGGLWGAIQEGKQQLTTAVGEGVSSVAQARSEMDGLNAKRNELTSSLNGIKETGSGALNDLTGMQ